jgi:hypothetical protein
MRVDDLIVALTELRNSGQAAGSDPVMVEYDAYDGGACVLSVDRVEMWLGRRIVLLKEDP